MNGPNLRPKTHQILLGRDALSVKYDFKETCVIQSENTSTLQSHSHFTDSSHYYPSVKHCIPSVTKNALRPLTFEGQKTGGTEIQG